MDFANNSNPQQPSVHAAQLVRDGSQARVSVTIQSAALAEDGSVHHRHAVSAGQNRHQRNCGACDEPFLRMQADALAADVIANHRWKHCPSFCIRERLCRDHVGGGQIGSDCESEI